MNWKSEKHKEDKNLSIYLNYSCSLHAKFPLIYKKVFFNKYTASYGVIYVTLTKITV